MGHKVWLLAIIMLLCISSVLAAPSVKEQILDTTSYSSSASNDRNYGYRLMILQNCSLYTVQKNASHNPTDAGQIVVLNWNTSQFIGEAAWSGDNATFATPLALTKGMYLYIFENETGTRTLRYEFGAITEAISRTYANYTTACYGEEGGGSLCDNPHTDGNANGAVMYLYFEPPSAPVDTTKPTYSNIWTNTTPIYLGENYTVRIRMTDETSLGRQYFHTNQTAPQEQNTALAEGKTTYYYNISTQNLFGWLRNWRKPGNHTVMWNFTVNDSSNNINQTYNILVNITDKYPLYSGAWGFTNGSTYISAPFYINSNFAAWRYARDDSNISTMNMTYRNATHIMKTTIYTPTKMICTVANRYCRYPLAGAYLFAVTLNNTGDWSIKTCANDTSNQWTCRMHNFTVLGNNPGWYDYGSNATAGKIYEKGSVKLFSNWTVAAGSLTYFQLREQLPNGTWYLNNASAATPFVCGNYSNCAAEVTSAGTMEPVGIHTFVFTANSTASGFNQTPGFTITLLNGMWLNDSTPTYFGSDLFRRNTTGDMTSVTETGSAGFSRLSYPPLTKDIVVDKFKADEIFLLDGDTLKIYQGKQLTLLNTTTLRGVNHHQVIIMPNWTANYSVLSLSEDYGNIILSDLRISGNGSVFVYNYTNITSWFTGYGGGEFNMGCGNETCVVAFTASNSSWVLATHQYLYALSFSKDLTQHSPVLTLQDNLDYGAICFSQYKNLDFGNIDGRKGYEAVFATVALNNEAGCNPAVDECDESLAIWILNSTGGTLQKQKRMNVTLGNFAHEYDASQTYYYCYNESSGNSTNAHLNRFFTNTLVFNSGVNESTLEVHVGYYTENYNTAETDWDWNIAYFTPGVYTLGYVSVWGDQGLMSNLIAVGLATPNAFCGYGFQPSGDDQIMCGINATSLTESVYDINGRDLAYRGDWSDALHYSNFVNNSADFVIRESILYESGGAIDSLYYTDYTYALTIPIRSQGAMDWIMATSTSLYYLDDDWEQAPANITWWSVNPCIYDINGLEVFWENTTRVIVKVNVTDTNLFNRDNVSLRHILYNGSAHEQVGAWKYSNQTEYQFIINTSVNYTTQNTSYDEVFIIQAKDTGNGTIVNESFLFRVNRSVIISTVEYGDCEFEMGDYVYDPTATPPGTFVNNSFIQAVKEVGSWVGFTGGAIKVFWILIMAAVAFFLWIKMGGENPQLASGLIVGVELLLLFVGYSFKLIPGFILFLLLFAGVIIGILFFKKRVMDS